VTTKVEVARSVTPDLSQLWDEALRGLRAHRGGPEMMDAEMGQRDPSELLSQLVKDRGITLAFIDETLVGFAAVELGVIEAIYVERSRRRQGVGRSLVDHLLNSPFPPRDAHVLPGDRAMKSLYESFGWKARLLTMRGE